ncbi:hypothetical protein [Chitinophaga agri]|uniref:Uncharacterized protein n=1 Tax=Chitinophaga agri TaxID=2703787 RepID=A0A6B9ZQA7_9BACT|nr:hypothetical protein [Chitinophaga agri]QHS63565.1 hypothetical protein GWR21_29480 [Chitinophaga agri]
MRFLAIILSLFILLETVAPCCLWDSCAQETTSSEKDGNKSQGDCSPFAATCSTCVAGANVPEIQSFSMEAPLQFIKHVAGPLSFILSTYSEPHYQPPRVA